MLNCEVNYAGRFDNTTNVAYHSHEGPELIYVHQGRCRIHVAQGTFDLSADQVLIIPAKAVHDQINKKRVVDTYIRCTVPGNHFFRTARVVNCARDAFVARWFEDMWHLSESQNQSWREEGQTLLQSILCRLRRHEATAQEHKDAPPALQQSKQYIETHIRNTLTVDDIAEHVMLSPSHLSRLWRDHMHCPPLRYQQQLRLQHAKNLLNNRYLRINDIARQIGYDDENYFGRLFKKHIGVSPGTYRKQLRDS